MIGSPDTVAGPLILILIPFGMLLAVVWAVYLAGFHTELFAPGRWLKGLALAALAAALSFGLYGYSFRSNDHQAQQLPILERLADPQAYPGDSYVDTADQFPSFAADQLARQLPGAQVPRLFLGLHLLVLILAGGAFLFLSTSLFGDVFGALIGLVLFSISYPLHLASPLSLEVVLRDHFDLTTAGFPLMIFGLSLWFSGLTALASSAGGLLFYINPLLAVQLLAVLAFSEAARFLLGRGKVYILQPLSAVLPAALVAAPALYRTVRPGTFGGSAAFAQALKLWYPINYFASVWGAAHWAYAAAALGLFALCVWRARRYEEYESHVPAFLLGLAGVWLAGFIFSDVFPQRAVLVAQFYRTDILLVVLALACAGHAVREYWHDAKPAAWAFGGLLLLSFVGPPRPLVLALTAALWLLFEKHKNSEFQSYGPALKSGMYAAGGLLAAVGFRGLWPGSGFAPGPDVSLGLLLLSLLFLAALYRSFKFPKALRVLGAALAAALALAPSYRVIRYRLKAKTWETASDKDREVQALADWESERGDAAARFLVPPMERFRVALKHPVVFEWLDGAAMHWAPGFDRLWMLRVRDFHIDPAVMAPFWQERERAIASFDSAAAWTSPGEQAYRSLSEKDFAALASKYQADVLITYTGMPHFKTFFQEEGASKDFVIYNYKYNYAP